jgi:methionyl-tRNA synthetase
MTDTVTDTSTDTSTDIANDNEDENEGQKASYYLTTPIYYVNDRPHIGHAYTSLACDVLARFMRLDGRDVFFLTGTDEHGQKVEKAAAAAGEDPQSFADRVSVHFSDLARDMNFSNDAFIRTTEVRHAEASQALWRAMEASGDIYLGKYAGWYSVRDEAFFTESELSDDENGKKRAPSGAEVEWVEEPSYFFKLSAWQDRLLAFYESHPEFIGPSSRRNEVLSFVKGGLEDLSISRTSFKWGVPVPDAPGHVMYVWVDALTNYLTAVGYPDKDISLLSNRWPADLHMVGKDILRFHAVYWPAFLMSAGVDVPLRIYAHGWLMNRGEKMSKSLGNVVSPYDLIEKYGLDQVRYYLMREVSFGQDGYISHETMAGRINGDLANDLGNLGQRVLSMVAKNCDAKVPSPGSLTEEDEMLLNSAAGLLDIVRKEFSEQAFHKALASIWRVVGDANRYVDATAPWALKKTDPERMATVLYVLCEAIRNIGLLVQPIMPKSASAILDQVAVPEDQRSFAYVGTPGRLAAGIDLPAPSPVFPRFVEEEESADSGTDES